MGDVDSRLEPLTLVMGLEGKTTQKAYTAQRFARASVHDRRTGWGANGRVLVCSYGHRRGISQHARRSPADVLCERMLSPESAPFKDKETGSRWTVVGRSVDGPLKGKQLDWIDSIQSRWYAWAANYPETAIYATSK